jgi:hypothetical protein
MTEKRTGRKKTAPPTMATVTSLFGEDAHPEKSKAGKVVVPPPGKRDKSDTRKRNTINIDGPGSATLRVGKRWAEIIAAVNAGEYTWEEFVEALDPAELARGQLKAGDGSFRGRPPQLVPRAFFNACQNEIMKRGKRQWQENYPEALKTITELAGDASVKADIRLKAAIFVAERIEGKAVQPMAVTVEDPWQVALAGVVAEVKEDEAIARAHNYTERIDSLEGGGDDGD